jgi:hypothetical protein
MSRLSRSPEASFFSSSAISLRRSLGIVFWSDLHSLANLTLATKA